MREALAPKPDDKGGRKKWAAVCCDAAAGHRPGDPVFTAWLRLAATPVRDVKAAIGDGADERRPRRGQPRQGGARQGGPREGGPREGAPRPSDRNPAKRAGPRGEGGRRDGRPSREELAAHARGGTLKTSIRIVETDKAEEKRERERRRKEERERKRQAERERLERFGY